MPGNILSGQSTPLHQILARTGKSAKCAQDVLIQCSLLRALVTQNIERFMERKRSSRTADALADLTQGWYGWIDFAGENPKLFRLMIESTRSDPSATASQEGFVLMREIVERSAAEGRLATDVDTAARTIWAASNGVLTLFMDGTPPVEIKRTAELLFSALTAELVRAK